MPVPSLILGAAVIRDMGPVDTSTPAVVLKFDPNVMHHGGLGVIRSLGRVGVPVYGVHEGPWAPAASSRYLAGRFFWQPGPADVDRVLTGLLLLAERSGGRASCSRPTMPARSSSLSMAVTCDPRSCFRIRRADLPRRLAGKYSLHRGLPRIGFSSPATVTPDSLARRGNSPRHGYPLIAKLTTPWTKGSGLRSTSVVASQQGTGHAYEACARAGAGLMLQEFIPGGPGHDWFFHGYCDVNSVCRPLPASRNGLIRPMPD